MAKFILGYDADNDDELRQYNSVDEADFESEEWCTVEADTLEEAKQKYETSFANWQRISSKHLDID